MLLPFEYHSSFQESLHEELLYCKLPVRALYILYKNCIMYYYRMIPEAQYHAGGQENDEVQCHSINPENIIYKYTQCTVSLVSSPAHFRPPFCKNGGRKWAGDYWSGLSGLLFYMHEKIHAPEYIVGADCIYA